MWLNVTQYSLPQTVEKPRTANDEQIAWARCAHLQRSGVKSILCKWPGRRLHLDSTADIFTGFPWECSSLLRKCRQDAGGKLIAGQILRRWETNESNYSPWKGWHVRTAAARVRTADKGRNIDPKKVLRQTIEIHINLLKNHTCMNFLSQ